MRKTGLRDDKTRQLKPYLKVSGSEPALAYKHLSDVLIHSDPPMAKDGIPQEGLRRPLLTAAKIVSTARMVIYLHFCHQSVLRPAQITPSYYCLDVNQTSHCEKVVSGVQDQFEVGQGIR